MKSNQRLLVIALASIGCLALAPSLNGCSGGTDRDTDTSGTDAGSTDAGRDAGTDAGHDAGTVVNNDHTIGGPCTATASGEQGDCDADLTCIMNPPIGEAGGLCTKTCTADADCGMNGTIANICAPVSTTESICVRGCDPIIVDSCNRATNACRPLGGGKGACDIRCTELSAGCPAGTACSATTGLCEGGKYYDTCDAEAAGSCSAGNECLYPQDGDPQAGICFQDCTTAANSCPAKSTCVINTGANKFCAKTCGGVTDPPCPTNSSCLNVTQTAKACLFKLPPGTRQAYESCDGTNRCVADTDCLVPQGGGATGTCFTNCTTNANACAAGNSCLASTPGNKNCFKTCTGTEACPNGKACSNGLCGP